MIRIFGINNCTSVRNALNFFQSKNIEVDYINLKKELPKWEEMKEIKDKSGFDLITLFNSNGKLFKEMKLADKLKFLTEDEALKLLVTDALLIKRPLLVDNNFVRVGWNKKEYEAKWG